MKSSQHRIDASHVSDLRQRWMQSHNAAHTPLILPSVCANQMKVYWHKLGHLYTRIFRTIRFCLLYVCDLTPLGLVFTLLHCTSESEPLLRQHHTIKQAVCLGGMTQTSPERKECKRRKEICASGLPTNFQLAWVAVVLSLAAFGLLDSCFVFIL